MNASYAPPLADAPPRRAVNRASISLMFRPPVVLDVLTSTRCSPKPSYCCGIPTVPWSMASTVAAAVKTAATHDPPATTEAAWQALQHWSAVCA
jgi:hypothetical protein